MVNPQEFKEKIKSIISQEYKIEFLGENFEKIVEQLSEPKVKIIYSWIKRVIERDIQPITIGSNKEYKQWKINDLMTFVHKFNQKNVEYRILFVKVKNSFYIEFHLGDHKYYDKVRKSLDLKKSSY